MFIHELTCLHLFLYLVWVQAENMVWPGVKGDKRDLVYFAFYFNAFSELTYDCSDRGPMWPLVVFWCNHLHYSLYFNHIPTHTAHTLIYTLHFIHRTMIHILNVDDSVTLPLRLPRFSAVEHMFSCWWYFVQHCKLFIYTHWVEYIPRFFLGLFLVICITWCIVLPSPTFMYSSTIDIVFI